MPALWNPRPKDERLAALTLPQPGAPLTPEAAKDLALTVALRGLGYVAPNPLVGAVLVDREHRFLAAGAHLRVGTAHAEIQALQAFDAWDNGHATPPALTLAGGTLYVTLEPCAHTNRTPACAPRVGASGLARVVYGAVDPNPAVNGRGAALLQAAGVTAVHDTGWEPACLALAETFLWHIRHRTPFVALKAATSLDGAIARTGDRRAWLTGERARAYGHFLRGLYDAIVVGQGTLLADDPWLDTRSALTPVRPPRRVVLDPDGRALKARPRLDWRVLNGSDATPVLWVHGPSVARDCPDGLAALAARGVDRVELPVRQDGTMDPGVLLDALTARGVTSLLLEGGAGLYGSFLSAGAVNKLHLFQAPRLLGRAGALTWTDATGALTSSATEMEKSIEITPLGDDWLIDATLTRATAPQAAKKDVHQ